MFDFKYIMHHWKRMCDWYDKQFGENCCNKCPLHEHSCGGIFETDPNEDWDDIVKKVDAWACVHKEKVYPTWREFIHDYCVKLNPELRGCNDYQFVAVFMSQPIEADTAEKLGLKPKEEW